MNVLLGNVTLTGVHIVNTCAEALNPQFQFTSDRTRYTFSVKNWGRINKWQHLCSATTATAAPQLLSHATAPQTQLYCARTI